MTHIRLPDLAHLLGIAYRPRRGQIDHIRQLTRACGFPAPIGIRMVDHKEVRGAEAVYARSRWDKALVDHWFEERERPADRASADALAKASLRASLATRAKAIFGRAAA